MKEATGELNMTVVTLIAVAALGALFYFVVWPMVQRMVIQQTCNTYGPDYKAYINNGEFSDTCPYVCENKDKGAFCAIDSKSSSSLPPAR